MTPPPTRQHYIHKLSKHTPKYHHTCSEQPPYFHSLPWAERRIYDTECTRGRTDTPNPVLCSFLFGFHAKLQLLGSLFRSLILAGLHCGKVHTNTREVPDIPVQRSIRWRGHDLEGAIMLATLVSKHGHNRSVVPRDIGGREGYFEAIVREVDGSWHIEDTLHGVEEERYELDGEVISGGRRIRRGGCDSSRRTGNSSVSRQLDRVVGFLGVVHNVSSQLIWYRSRGCLAGHG